MTLVDRQARRVAGPPPSLPVHLGGALRGMKKVGPYAGAEQSPKYHQRRPVELAFRRILRAAPWHHVRDLTAAIKFRPYTEPASLSP